MRRKKILVTGGAGFLGSHLCETLLSQDHEVICLDDFSTSSKENVSHLMDHPRFSLFEHDVCRVLYIDVDEIYNLACPASPTQYQKEPIQTLRTSVLGAYNMLELARKNKAKILQASTSEVYGDPQIHPQDESYWGHVNPIGIRSCYDEGKRCAETLFFDYHRKYKLSIKVARIFNTYGPRMQPQDGRVVSNFFVQTLKNMPLTIYGNGKQTRSFCYVSDMVDALISFMEADSWITGPINLGNPDEFTINDLANKILTITQSKSTIIYEPLPKDDPKQRKPDISSAKKLLYWKPTFSLDEGLQQSVEFFRNYLRSLSEEDLTLSNEELASSGVDGKS